MSRTPRRLLYALAAMARDQIEHLASCGDRGDTHMNLDTAPPWVLHVHSGETKEGCPWQVVVQDVERQIEHLAECGDSMMTTTARFYLARVASQEGIRQRYRVVVSSGPRVPIAGRPCPHYAAPPELAHCSERYVADQATAMALMDYIVARIMGRHE